MPDFETNVNDLTTAYWKLCEHASTYRGTKQFRKTYEAWQANRDDPLPYQRHVIHEFFARGIEAAAQDIAELLDELLDVPEHEISERAP